MTTAWVVTIAMPDNVTAPAFPMALAAGGCCHRDRTTPLLSVDEGRTAMKHAGSSGGTSEFTSLRLLHSSFQPSRDHSPGGLIRFVFVVGFGKPDSKLAITTLYVCAAVNGQARFGLLQSIGRAKEQAEQRKSSHLNCNAGPTAPKKALCAACYSSWSSWV
jgi:hypothetical protein